MPFHPVLLVAVCTSHPLTGMNCICLGRPMLKQLLWMVYVLLVHTWQSAHCAHGSSSFFKDHKSPQLLSRPGPSTSGYKAKMMRTKGEQGDVEGDEFPRTSHSSNCTCSPVDFLSVFEAVGSISHSGLAMSVSCLLQLQREGLTDRKQMT